MKFLVRIDVQLPPSLAQAERESLLARERARGEELKADGAILDMWRVPGRLANVGIWSAADATELHEALSSLPVFPWTQIEVTALARHYLSTPEREEQR